MCVKWGGCGMPVCDRVCVCGQWALYLLLGSLLLLWSLLLGSLLLGSLLLLLVCLLLLI